MRQAAARMILAGLTTVSLYGVLLLVIDRLPGVDIAQPVAIYWTLAWALGAVFAGWNLRDSWMALRSVSHTGESLAVKAGGFWMMRSDLLQCSACVLMVAAGLLAIVQWSTVDVRTALILAGGLSIVANQVWNRIDRERVTRMPSVRSEARALGRLASEIAALARDMGHDIDNIISVPVGELEILRERPGMTPSEIAGINVAISKLMTLADVIHGLHQQVKDRDPSARRVT